MVLYSKSRTRVTISYENYGKRYGIKMNHKTEIEKTSVISSFYNKIPDLILLKSLALILR
jgi:hypothetical protein